MASTTMDTVVPQQQQQQQQHSKSLSPRQPPPQPKNGVSVRRHNSLPSRYHQQPRQRTMTSRGSGPMPSTTPSSSSSSTPTRALHQPEPRHYTMKFNPYVGWFRHSPDTSRRSNFWNSSTTNKNNQLLGLSNVAWFPKSSKSSTAGLSCKQSSLKPENHTEDQDTATQATMHLLSLLRATFPVAATIMHELGEAGRLRGGSPSPSSLSLALYNHQDHLWKKKKNNNKDRSLSLSLLSSTKLFLHVAQWVFKPFLEDFLEEDSYDDDDERDDYASSSLKSLDNDSLTTVPDEDEHDEDFDKPGQQQQPQHSYQRQRSSSFLGDASSQEAEAYYAHQAAKELNPDEVSPSRLNHVITQMDIIRMQRNASRHLDVESIYQLPTVTYRKNRQESATTTRSTTTTTASSATTEKSSEAWSWMLIGALESNVGAAVAAKPQDQGQVIVQAKEDEEDVCVICLERFVYGDRLRVLPCNHSFHTGCIDRWLSGSASFENCHTNGCPTCKKRPIVCPPTQEYDIGCGQQQQQQQQVQETTSKGTTAKETKERGDHGSLILAGETSDGNVPSWAFCELGSALLARDSQYL